MTQIGCIRTSFSPIFPIIHSNLRGYPHVFPRSFCLIDDGEVGVAHQGDSLQNTNGANDQREVRPTLGFAKRWFLRHGGWHGCKIWTGMGIVFSEFRTIVDQNFVVNIWKSPIFGVGLIILINSCERKHVTFFGEEPFLVVMMTKSHVWYQGTSIKNHGESWTPSEDDS